MSASSRKGLLALAGISHGFALTSHGPGGGSMLLKSTAENANGFPSQIGPAFIAAVVVFCGRNRVNDVNSTPMVRMPAIVKRWKEYMDQ